MRRIKRLPSGAGEAETRAAARAAQIATHPDRHGDSLEANAASQWANGGPSGQGQQAALQTEVL